MRLPAYQAHRAERRADQQRVATLAVVVGSALSLLAILAAMALPFVSALLS